MTYLSSFDGTRLWFDVVGKDGDPILLIAGNGCDHSVWNSVLEAFAKEHQVIYYDHRGTGKSDDNFTGTWSTRDFARDAACVVRAAGFERVHAYGHSMGGRVAQWLAIDHPEAIGALVLGATSLGEKHGVPRPLEATRAMMSGDPAALQRMSYTDEWIEQNSELAKGGAPNPTSRESFMAHLAASTSHDTWEELPRISNPTLVLHGSDDQITLAANAELIVDRIPGAQLLLIHGARHVYWAGFPQANDAIFAFLRETKLQALPRAL